MTITQRYILAVVRSLCCAAFIFGVLGAKEISPEVKTGLLLLSLYMVMDTLDAIARIKHESQSR